MSATPTPAPSAAASGLRREVHLDLARARRPLLALAALAAFACYAAMGLLRLQQLHAGAYDLGIFTQVVDNLAHFHAPAAPLDVKAHADFFGDHFEPILVLLVPLWWIHAGPATLIVAQAALVATAVPFVHAFAARRLGQGLAWAVTFCFASCWGVQSMVSFDFHELAFAVPLLAVALERADAGKFRTSAVAACALLLVKEDMGLLVVELGLFYLLYWRRRRLGVAVIAAGVGGFLLLTQLIIPTLNPHGSYLYWQRNFSELAPTPAGIPGQLLRHPAKFVRLLADSPLKRQLLEHTALAWLGLPLLSPFFLLAVPLYLERLWSSLPAYWMTVYHYDGLPAVICALGTADTLARIRGRLARRGEQPARVATVGTRVLAGLLVAVALFAFPLSSPLRAFLDPSLVSVTPTAAEAGCRQLIGQVPAGAVAEASAYLAPQLAPGRTVYLPGEARLVGVSPTYLLDQRNPWPGGGDGHEVTDVAAYERDAVKHGYTAVARAGGCTLWRAPSAGR